MKKTKTNLNADAFPKELQRLLKDANVYDSSCSSDALVYYIDTGYYIKIDSVHSLAAEAELSKLFYSRGFGVEVIDYISTDKDYLVTRSAIGNDLTHYLHNPKKLCEILSASLRELHTQSIFSVPVSSR